MPYTPTWNSPYQQGGISYTPPQSQTVQPYQSMPTSPVPMQPFNGVEKVTGKDSLYQLPMPPNSTSKPYFDMGGKHFFIATTDAAGVKTVETFDYFPHKDEEPVRIDGAQFVSRQEYDQFVAKVGAALEALNGVHGPVSPAGSAANGTQGQNVNAQANDAGRPIGAAYQPMPD